MSLRQTSIQLLTLAGYQEFRMTRYAELRDIERKRHVEILSRAKMPTDRFKPYWLADEYESQVVLLTPQQALELRIFIVQLSIDPK